MLEDDETGAEPAEGLVSADSVFVEFDAAGSPPKRSSIVERCCDLVIQ